MSKDIRNKLFQSDVLHKRLTWDHELLLISFCFVKHSCHRESKGSVLENWTQSQVKNRVDKLFFLSQSKGCLK